MDTSKMVRVERVLNPKYKRDGLKSYVFAMQKYHFGPTMDGPYFIGQRAHHQGKFGQVAAKIGGKTTMEKILMKKPVGASEKEAATSATPVPATDIQNDSEYLCQVAIGTPAQNLNLDFDTGSADLWVWSTELPSTVTSANGSAHTIFDPTKSSTFKTSTGSTWNISYGDGSTASGTVGTDNILLGGITVEAQAIELANNLSTQFQQGAGDGLLGLAFGTINTVKPTPVATPPMNMITQKDIPANMELFTAHLGSVEDSGANSFYTFGYIDPATLTAAGVAEDSIYYTPVNSGNGFWEFPSSGATINGTAVSAGASNTAIADTGTTLALMSDAVVKAVYAAIPGAKYDATQQGYIFPTSTAASALPIVQVDINGTPFTIDKQHIPFADAGNGMSYGGIQSRGTQPLDILGDVFLKGVYAIFDLGNTRLGLVQETFGSTPAPTGSAPPTTGSNPPAAPAPTPAPTPAPAPAPAPTGSDPPSGTEPHHHHHHHHHHHPDE